MNIQLENIRKWFSFVCGIFAIVGLLVFSLLFIFMPILFFLSTEIIKQYLVVYFLSLGITIIFGVLSGINQRDNDIFDTQFRRKMTIYRTEEFAVCD